MVPRLRPRVFLDSNVVFSAVYSPYGPPGIILLHLASGDIVGVVSQMVLAEVVRAVRKKNPGILPVLRTLLVDAPIEVVADPPIKSVGRWRGGLSPMDAIIVEAAVAAKPDYFVTGDHHFLDDTSIAKDSGLRIVTPADYLKRQGDWLANAKT
ncbi:MAG: hypothetical protein A2147_01705 [Chloroflexi bacterium RBG_16_57_8]|nr:MAG: hypothetical protein A2147_01705 [Chloroflexi bacterium RBG_16_57_8]